MIDAATMELCWNCFKSLGQKAFALNHYDLATNTRLFTPEIWKEFLTNPDVAEWVNSEIAVLQESELKKLLSNVSSSQSLGRAQLINALAKLREDAPTKDGPVFIYTYVPLDEQQEHAPNTHKLDRDIFTPLT